MRLSAGIFEESNSHEENLREADSGAQGQAFGGRGRFACGGLMTKSSTLFSIYR
jgi:hypothetical protein